MNEQFKAAGNKRWGVTDDAFVYNGIRIPYSQLTSARIAVPSKSWFSCGVANIDDNGNILVCAYEHADRDRVSVAIKYVQSKIEEAQQKEKKEYRMRCNICGNVYCYNKADLARNRHLMSDAVSSARMGVLEALAGTTIAANQQLARIDALQNQVVDYSRCPQCKSTDITELSEEEWTKVQSKALETTNTAMDELKKLKELLDMGIVTQEEFDAKKKQLLGL